MIEMSIGQVARQSGVRPSTLRYYESIGLLPAPNRINGKRRYDKRVLERLAIIRTAQQAGFTLAELRVLFEDVLDGPESVTAWHTLIERKIQEVNERLRHVQVMKRLLEDIRGCDDAALAECIYEIGQRELIA